MIEFFFDPIYQASLIGTLLMAFSSSLLGVFVLLAKRSLVVETLSHAAYPGIALGLLLGGAQVPGMLTLGGLFAALLALRLVSTIEKRGKMGADPALCFTMASFLGVGALLASYLQGISPVLSKKMDTFLFGQAATMLSWHIYLYLGLALCTGGWIAWNFHPLKAMAFDLSYKEARGLNVAITLLTTLAVVVGTRCVGVVLMAGMIIAPAVAARQWVRSLGMMLVLAALFGVGSALGGSLLAFKHQYVAGPLIVCISGGCAVVSLLYFYAQRLIRKVLFRQKCLEENILKYLWKRGGCCSREELTHCFPSLCMTPFALARLRRQGWLVGACCLSQEGLTQAEQIVRLHRLWELYLSSNLGFMAQDVHPSAEQMEHILTPELERELTRVLKNPQSDPHEQPIPGGA